MPILIMTSINIFLNAQQSSTDENYQNWSVKFKPYFETYDLLNNMMEEKMLQQLFANPMVLQIKAYSKEFSYKTMILRMIFMH